MQPGITAAGLVIGILIGLTGMGGGSLTTPFLILFAGLHPALAVGTDMVYSAVTKWLGAIVHLRQRTVDLRLAGLVAAGTVPSSLIAVRLVHLLGASADEVIKKGLGAALMLVAAVIVLRRRLIRNYSELDVKSGSEATVSRTRNPLLVVGLGATVGFVVGLTSVGSGTLIVVALLMLYPSLPLAKVAGTDVFQGALLTSAAGLTYMHFGQVRVDLVVSLLAGSLPGVVIGSRLSARTPERILRPVLAVVLAAAGARLL